MQIFKTDKSFKSSVKQKALELIKNITAKPSPQENILDKLLTEQIERTTQDISDWRTAVEAAEDDINPDREELLVMYEDIIDDYQVWAGMDQRITKAISGGFQIIDENGDIDEDEQKKFLDPKGNPLPWFRALMKIIMEAKFYGYEVAQLGPVIDDIFQSVEKIPELNLIPRYRAILIDSRVGFSESNAIAVNEDPQWTWLIEAGSKTDLGLLNKIAPLFIYKKVFAAWSQHADIFAMPFRIGRTDLRDTERRQNMIDMMEDMGRASYGVVDPTDEIEFIQQSGTDPFKIYDALITKCDQGISKIILSQTGTTDEKAFAGSAGVHQNTLDDLIRSDKLDISAIITDQLIPKMKQIGMIAKEKKIWGVWDFSEKMSIKDWLEKIPAMAVHYKISAEEVNKKTGLEVEEKEELDVLPDNKMTTNMNKVQNYYKDFLKNG